MSTPRRTYPREFKQEAVRLVTEQRIPLAQVARDLGISEKILQRWKTEYLAQGSRAFPGQGVSIEDELTQLRREVQLLRREREILKKATIFFARHAPEE